MQLPSIDKNPRNPVKPAGSQVKKIQQTDEVHSRDYAYEMDRILDDDSRPKHQPPPEFGEDTYEASDNQSDQEEPKSVRPDDRNRASDDDDSNIDIQI